jgi:hypothetical protein
MRNGRTITYAFWWLISLTVPGAAQTITLELARPVGSGIVFSTTHIENGFILTPQPSSPQGPFAYTQIGGLVGLGSFTASGFSDTFTLARLTDAPFFLNSFFWGAVGNVPGTSPAGPSNFTITGFNNATSEFQFSGSIASRSFLTATATNPFATTEITRATFAFSRPQPESGFVIDRIDLTARALAAPGPIAGAGLPALVALIAAWAYRRRFNRNGRA